MILNRKIEWIKDGSGVLMANKQRGGLLDWPELQEAYAEIAFLTLKQPIHSMINCLPAGVIVPVHTDRGNDKFQRWHYPITTNNHSYYWDEKDGIIHMRVGHWYPTNHEIRHTIMNFGRTDRIHLVVDTI